MFIVTLGWMVIVVSKQTLNIAFYCAKTVSK